MMKTLLIVLGFITFGMIAGWAAEAGVSTAQEWIEVTMRLQQQIDECRADTRDLSIVERDIKELQARVLMLENQVEALVNGDKNAARLMRNWERWGDE
jgi:hypothetical protein